MKTMQTTCFCVRRQMRAALQEAAASPMNSMISNKSGNAARSSVRRGLHSARHLRAEARTAVKHTLGSRRFRLAVVGSGPAGFYSASRILAMHGSENTTVDMYEELPVPFGLVRYGVAPDHPEVKNCIHKFEEVALDKRFRYFGNVQIGGPSSDRDGSFKSLHPSHLETRHALSVPLAFLRPYYDAMLFTYGASDDRSLGAAVHNDDAPNLDNVLTARSFVHWYNGHPHSPLHRGLQNLDLSQLHKADIIGQGNVALDCARILLSGGTSKDVSRLAKTDVPESVLAELARSRISQVDIVGRRGPLQFAGTTKEVRELVSLASSVFNMDEDDRTSVASASRDLEVFEGEGGVMENSRMKKRLLGLMQKSKSPQGKPAEGQKAWSLKFCRSPFGLYGADGSAAGPVKTVHYEMNDLQPVSTSTLPSGQGADPSAVVAHGTGEVVKVQADLVLKSVGYRSVGVPGLPFDARKGIVRNEHGRITEPDGTQLPGLYVSGWLARGPNGVIATTMYNAFETAELIASDFGSDSSLQEARPDLPDLQQAGFGNQRVVSWDDWKAIDVEERRRGEKLGKEREKFVTVDAMLRGLG